MGGLNSLICINFLHLSCQKKLCIYEILETTYPIELKFSGIREGVNNFAVLEFQSNPTIWRKNVKIGNSGKTTP